MGPDFKKGGGWYRDIVLRSGANSRENRGYFEFGNEGLGRKKMEVELVRLSLTCYKKSGTLSSP